MRTTVTLDPDVERLLKEAMRRHSKPFKQALNEAIRQGLSKSSSPAAKSTFVVKARPMGLRPGVDPARLGDVATDLEVEAFRDVTARLARKAKK
jgi:hypothetical protein